MNKKFVDHVALAKTTWPILVELARSGDGPISYGELCRAMKLHHRSAGYFLASSKHIAASIDCQGFRLLP